MQEQRLQSNSRNVEHRRLVLLWFVVISAVYLPPEAASILFFLIILLALLQGWLSRIHLITITILPFIAIIFLGVLSSKDAISHNILKDFWYFSLPIISLVVGWALAEEVEPKKLQLHIIYLGTTLSILLILKASWLLVFESVDYFNKYYWRQALGAGEFISVWGLLVAFGLISKTGFKHEHAKFISLLMVINLISIIISDSRTAMIMLSLGLFLVFVPAIVKKMRRVYWVGLAIGIILIIIFASVPGEDTTTTLGRFQNMFREQFSVSFVDSSDINNKYRAFESIAAIDTFLSGNLWDQFVGHGFGKMIDLKVLIPLGVPGEINDYQFIPILHNGYLYVLIKTGVLGLLIYIYFMARSFRNFLRVKIRTIDQLWPNLGMAVILGSIIGTMSMAGPYNRGAFFTTYIILGICMQGCSYKVQIETKPENP